MTKLLSEQQMISGKVRKTAPGDVPLDRYEWIKIQDAEPDLGLPPEDNSFASSDADGSRTWLVARDGLSIDANNEIIVDETTLPIDTSGLNFTSAEVLSNVLADLNNVLSNIETVQTTFLSEVTSDDSMSGDGTPENPLSVGQPVAPVSDVTFAKLTVDNISIDNNIISSTNTNGDIRMSPNGTGAIDVDSSRINNLLEPNSPTDAANKQYVDDIAQGIRTLPSARAHANYHLDSVYDNGNSGVGSTLTSTTNGALVVDDVTDLETGDNVIVNGQSNGAENGAYILTQQGDASNPWILTRSFRCDEPDEQPGAFQFVTSGSQYSDTGWVLTTDVLPIVMGTTSLKWLQFSGAGTYRAGVGLSLDGTIFSNDGVISLNATNNLSVDATKGNVSITDNGTPFNTVGALVARDASGDFSANIISAELNGNSATTTRLKTSRTFTITGAVATGSFSGFNGTQNVEFEVTQQPDSVTLGTHTVGDYVDDVLAGTGITVTGTAGEGWDPEISLSHLGLEALIEPTRDSIFYWNLNNATAAWLSTGDGIEISGNLLENTQRAFRTIEVAGSTTIEANQINDTLTVEGGQNINLSTNISGDKLIISTNSVGDSAYESSSISVGVASPVVVDSFAMAVTRSVKYYVQITQGTSYQVSELMVMHDGSSSYSVEYAVLESNGELGTIDTRVTGPDVELTVAMLTADIAEIRVKRLLFDI